MVLDTSIVELIAYIISSLAAWEGGKYGIARLKEKYYSDDGFDEDVCDLKHRRIDERLDDISKLLATIAEQIDSNTKAIAELVSLDGPIHKAIQRLDDKLDRRTESIGKPANVVRIVGQD